MICAFLFSLGGCDNNGDDTYSDISNTQISGTGLPSGSDDERVSYAASTNFLKRTVSPDGSCNYAPLLGGIVYDGGEMELYVEFTFSGSRENVKSMDGIALLFIDGYIQEFSVENGEKALVHNVTVPNNESGGFGFGFEPTTYDKDSDKHTIVMVILPKWAAGHGNFIKDSAVMAVGREITLNKINTPKEDNIVRMNIRERTSWDDMHSELPFKRGTADTDLVFHCRNAQETSCYLFCGGKLITHEGKCIFYSENKDEKAVSYFGVSVNESDIGKTLYVLYVPKDYFGAKPVETTCNYLWE